MKKAALAVLLLSVFWVPIFLNLRNGEKAGQFWDGEDACYVSRGQPEYASAVFNRKLLLVALPILFGVALAKSLRS